MVFLAAISTALFLISASLNVLQFLYAKKQRKKPVESIELKEFLADLFSGKVGMFAVSRIDTDSILLRSPRSR